MRIAVVGLGSWGCALSQHLATKGVAILGWDTDLALLDEIRFKRENSRYLPGQILHESIHTAKSLEEVASESVVLIALPSKALSSVSPKFLGALPRDATIVSVVKGFEPLSAKTPLSFLREIAPSLKYCSLSGPSFAKDIVKGLPASIVAASKDAGIAEKVAALFSSTTLRVYRSEDEIGVELGGALKNVIAIAAGVSDGLDLGDSARAGTITRGLAEITRLAVALGAKRETLSGLSGLGDLLMTATSIQSRNRKVGLRLGKGEKLEDILSTLGSTAEGVSTAPLALSLARSHGVEVPIIEGVNRLLFEGLNPRELAFGLITRPLRAEFD